MKFYQHAFKAMGTPCEIQLYSQTPAKATQVVNKVIAEIARLETRYSRYRNDSFLSKINQIAALGGSISVDAETAGLLNYAATCHIQSDGLFDITSGILRRAWRFDQNTLPDPQHLAALLEKVGWHNCRWQSPTLKFLIPGMELDFGGIVKEYAADRIAALCWTEGVQHGLINLGGDIKIIGAQPDGNPWRIAIRDPRHPDGLLQTLLLQQGALASSGDYERCITIAGVRYGHILNPKTGWPVQHLAAVSVAADFCVVAGSAATIAMLKAHNGIQWLEDLSLAHCWVDVTGKTGGSPAHGNDNHKRPLLGKKG
ncbi:MAG: FAD:protein FMN transferase [Methylococcaceae bacterium]|nr:FAD:protein FMN transferase [Methylococcaceae bacterium]